MGLLRVENLKKYFGEVHAVDGVTVAVDEGELVSVVGPNGSGKTTLVNLISGALIPDSGRIFFENKEITKLPPHKRVKLGIGRSFQIPYIYENLTSLENIMVSIFSRNGFSNVFYRDSKKYEMVRDEAMNLLEVFGIPVKSARELPHGHRKLLDVAMALSLKPKLVLLDEPTAGISIEERDEVINTIVGVLRSQKIAAIVVEHDMEVVAEHSDRIVVMSDGKVLKEGGKGILDSEEVRKILIGD